jgi:predicted AAA+ superfamily ATPase
MTTAQQMYHINLDQIASLIKATGHKRTTLVQGHMGTGKSSLLNALGRDLPTHTACYFDCTTKDLGDITLPNILNGRRTRLRYLCHQRGVGCAPQRADYPDDRRVW